MAKRVADEGLTTKIKECQTFAELASLKSQYVVGEFEKSVVFEKKLELIGRLLEEETQDEQLEFTANCTGPGDWNKDNSLRLNGGNW